MISHEAYEDTICIDISHVGNKLRRIGKTVLHSNSDKISNSFTVYSPVVPYEAMDGYLITDLAHPQSVHFFVFLDALLAAKKEGQTRQIVN